MLILELVSCGLNNKDNNTYGNKEREIVRKPEVAGPKDPSTNGCNETRSVAHQKSLAYSAVQSYHYYDTTLGTVRVVFFARLSVNESNRM